MSIRILRSGEVELVVPRRCSKDSALRFLSQKAGWVLRMLDDRGRRAGAEPPPWPAGLRTWSLVPWRGLQRELVIEPVEEGNPEVRFDGVFAVLSPPDSTPEDVSAALRSWMRDTLASEAGSLAERYAGILGLPAPRVRVREMRTLWGSCGSTGVITVNWHLAFLPAEALEYTVAHEVCHLRVRGHGRNFWSLLESVMPDYGRAKLLLGGGPPR
ncbi:M48 family metallopeptidase [Candidatus Fermentibacteria bacterium]|nr:M48 family metallopeptidase [Candidatus Fermentibacteria bacterium]